MTFGSLFSGIGGFDLGLELAGMECKWQVEIDDFCNRVLEKHWPNVRRYRDVREAHGNVAHAASLRLHESASIKTEEGSADPQFRCTGVVQGGPERCRVFSKTDTPCPSCLPAVDLICGGFPCQPFSVAGKQRGKADDRHLWPSMFRIVSELRPRWVLGENVPGLVRLGLDEVLSDLESIGYSCQTFDIPACAVDAPHVRHRVWIVGYAPKLHSDGSEHNGRSDRKSGGEIPEFGNTGRHEDVADAERKGPQGCERPLDMGLQGAEEQIRSTWPGSWPDEGEWFAESGIRRVSHGVPKRVDRLRSLGNAVVVPLVTQIGRMIVECER